MYQYDSKSKTPSDKFRETTTAKNKDHAQMNSLFMPFSNQENSRENPSLVYTSDPTQLMPILPYSPLQMQLMPRQEQREIQPLPIKLSEEQERIKPLTVKLNSTGIPLQMKENFESLSGFSFDDVRVHYNSDKPAQLQALAYTQGNQVYIESGQEKHLGHELAHVVQQKQGRVKPTMQLKGIHINDDNGLEHEADRLSNKAAQYTPESVTNNYLKFTQTTQYKKIAQGQFGNVAQRNCYWKVGDEGAPTKQDNLHTIDEFNDGHHNESRANIQQGNYYWVREGEDTNHKLYNSSDNAKAAALADAAFAAQAMSEWTKGEPDKTGKYYYPHMLSGDAVNLNESTYGWVKEGTNVVANHTSDGNATLKRARKPANMPLKVLNTKSPVEHYHAGTTTEDKYTSNASQPTYGPIAGAADHYLVKPVV